MLETSAASPFLTADIDLSAAERANEADGPFSAAC
jgi:hypothetical protein